MRQEDLLDEPVFIDLETRSAVDLKAAGGWNYAADPTTQLLTVAWSPAEGENHVWYPWHTIREDYANAQQTKVISHFGSDLPEALESVLDRRWCAHNAWNFDQLVWEKLFGEMHQPADWIDTEPLARAVGLPGGLDAIGKRLWGEGKYLPGKQTLKKYSKGATRYGDAADVPAGIMPMIAEYNIQDVFLLRGVWGEIVKWLKAPQSEWDVLAAHRTINHRGAAIDENLLVSLIDLTDEGRAHAVKSIAELTRGGRIELRTINDLQSRPTMLKWLDSIGVTVNKANSLRKELIQQFIDTHTSADSADEGDEDGYGLDQETETSADEARERARATGLAVRVLQLRSAALRITGGKLAAAASAVGSDGRVRGLFVYAGAHTFRWAGRRVQVQNFPRPKDGVKGWDFLGLFERTGKLTYNDVDALLPDRKDKRYRYLTPDDAASAISRSLFWPGDVAGWQEAADPLGLLAADLSGIEARVLAWLAGEKWLMQLFWDQGDPYIHMAEAIFGKKETWPGFDPADPKKSAKKHPYRQGGKIGELGSGYQMSGDKMNIFAATAGIDLAEIGTDGHQVVSAYRLAHPMIAGQVAGEFNGRPYFRDGFWHKLNDAAMSACKVPGQPYSVGVGAKVTFVMEGKHLMLYLPSGRRLVYREARVEVVQPKYLIGTDKTVEAVVFTSPRYGRVQMYGGKWTENVVQAVSRDFLAHPIVMIERAGIPVALHVHDEAVGEGRLSQKDQFMALFTTLPEWAVKFPLDAEGGWMPRYSKSPPPGERYKEEIWRNGAYLKPA